MTPNLAIVQFSNPHWRSFRIWVPLFLLWIPLLLLAPLLLLILLAACLVFQVSFCRSIETYWGILCGLRGTEVSVRAEENRIQVRIL